MKAPKPLASKNAAGLPRFLHAVMPWLLLALILGVHLGDSSSAELRSRPLQLVAAMAAAVAPAGSAPQPPFGQGAQPHPQQQHPQQNQQQQQQAGGHGPTNLTYLEALLSQPSPRHGLQQKGGLPKRWPVLLQHMTNRDGGRHGVPQQMTPEVYDWYDRALTFNQSLGHSNAGLQAPVPSCHFWVDHKYKVVYVRASKTAGTSLAAALGMKENPAMCGEDRAWCYQKCVGRQLCLRYMWDEGEVRQAFRDYTVFSFVRNPFARAISSWMHVNNRGVKPACARSFAHFAELPGGLGAQCMADPACCRQRFGWILEHTEPQAPCMFDVDGQPSVDFIGRTEHLEADAQALVDLINRRRPPGVERLRPLRLERLMVGDESLADDDARRRAYAQLYLDSPAALDDIRSYYRQDFEQLGFPDSPGSLQAALQAAADSGSSVQDGSSSSVEDGSSSSSSSASEEERGQQERIADLARAAEGGGRLEAIHLVQAAAQVAMGRRAGEGAAAAAAR